MRVSVRISGAGARSQRGLTIVELLVAVAIASLVLTSIFVVTSTTSRSFRLQNDMGRGMDRLNFAMDTVKSDLRRASFLGVPNSNVTLYPNFVRVCPTAALSAFAPNGLQSLVARNGAATYAPAVGNDIFEGAAPDTMLLFGAFRSVRRYPVSLLADGTNSTRIFTMGESLAQMNYEFDGSILGVTSNLGGMVFLRAGASAPVTADGAFADRVNVALVDQMSTGSGVDNICTFAGLTRENLEVVPMHFVRYDVRTDFTERSTVLVREELDYTGRVLASYIVARNVADFQVWFDSTTSAFGTQPTMGNDGEVAGTSLYDDDGTMPWTWVDGKNTSQPERARFGYVQLSTRLDTPIPTLANEGTGVGLRSAIEIFEPGEGTGDNWRSTGDFTRVMTIRSEVELDNFTLADL